MSQINDDDLKALRANVLDEIVKLGDHVADNDSVSYELLITLARDTGNTSLLDKAYQKIQAIEDPQQKVTALFDLLEEVEIQLNGEPAVEATDQDEQSSGDNHESGDSQQQYS